MKLKTLTAKIITQKSKKKILILTEDRYFSHVLNAMTSKHYFQMNTLSDPKETIDFIDDDYFLIIVDSSSIALTDVERQNVIKKVPGISFLDCSSNLIDGAHVPNPFSNLTKLKLQIHEILESYIELKN